MRTQATPGIEDAAKAFDDDDKDRARFLENNACIAVMKAHDRQGTSDTQILCGVGGFTFTLGDLRALIQRV